MKLKPFLKRYGRIIVGSTVIMVMALIAFFAPFLATHDPMHIDIYEQKQFPSSDHLMGTDDFGRDIYSRMVYGARVSLFVGVSTATISAVFGIILGLLMGYYKYLDIVLMRILEGISAFPQMLLALVLACVFGPGVDKIVIALTMVFVPGVARIVRSQVISIKECEHVESARAMGASDLRIIFKYILPLCISPLIIRFTSSMASAILTEASLSFLGVGIPPTIPTWGGILNSARNYVIVYPFMAIYPGVAIIITVLSISILGDGLRDVLDPKLK